MDNATHTDSPAGRDRTSDHEDRNRTTEPEQRDGSLKNRDQGSSSGNENMHPSSGNEEAVSPKVTGVVIAAAVVSAISALLYGYDTGIISGALLQITKDFGITSGWEQVIAASILVGAVIGALIGSQLSERLGRHRTTLIVATVYVIGALACSVSPTPVTLSLRDRTDRSWAA